MMIKRDGHTHTEYCPHGKVKDTEQLIQRAIALGFKEYSITEHAPLPPRILDRYAAGDMDIWTTASMPLSDTEHYLKHMHELKKKYASDLLIHVGFELDFFTIANDWTRGFLNEYGPQTDDGILSVHFLPGKDGLRSIDYSYEDYQDGIVEHWGSFQKAQEQYFEALIQSVEVDLGAFKPTRLGHISLCQKFEKYFDEDITFSQQTMLHLQKLFLLIKQKGYQLDLNTAGFDKIGYQKSYPASGTVKQAIALGIPLVYGSDSHALEEVGRHYDEVAEFLQYNQ